MTIRLAILYLHLIAAMFWVGEMLVLALIVTPVAARMADARQRAQFYQAIGRQSRPWMLGALALLVLTGLGNLWAMGIPLGALVQPALYAGGFGHTLGLKLGLVPVILVVTAVHDVAMRRIGRAQAGGSPPSAEQAARYRMLGRWVGRVNLVLGLVVIWLGLKLVAGG